MVLRLYDRRLGCTLLVNPVGKSRVTEKSLRSLLASSAYSNISNRRDARQIRCLLPVWELSLNNDLSVVLVTNTGVIKFSLILIPL